MARFALDYLAAFELPLLRVGKILSARAINSALAEFGSLIEYGENTILSLLSIFFHDVFRNLLLNRRKFLSDTVNFVFFRVFQSVILGHVFFVLLFHRLIFGFDFGKFFQNALYIAGYRFLRPPEMERLELDLSAQALTAASQIKLEIEVMEHD